jgi:alkanesulfonate monooxygenase SsuD/methylene tetrahydromethanopterin reductase-like flavin-dependent oxidoreductase (luciferase family)
VEDGMTSGEPTVRVGLRPPSALFERGAEELRRVVGRADQLAIDQMCVGDHVSFNGGQGFDGLVQATALAVLASRAAVQTAVYLLPLRHPLPVARQVASLALLAPGRFVFGVGVGGEDRHEVEICGVDPGTRGRRMDEALAIVRPLLAGETVTFDGEFFQVREAAILPALPTRVPIVVGGRSKAALRRAGVYGDGWLGLWVSPERFAAATSEVEAVAAAAGRSDVNWHHGLQIWCGFGSDRDDATPRLAAAMEHLYRVPFANFDRYSPRGTPEDVAEALIPYLDAGCRSINLIPAAGDIDESIEAVAAVRRLLLEVRSKAA